MINTLLLDLGGLLVDLLGPLVPVVQEDGAGILYNLELGADDSETGLDKAVLMRCPLILFLPCAG